MLISIEKKSSLRDRREIRRKLTCIAFRYITKGGIKVSLVASGDPTPRPAELIVGCGHTLVRAFRVTRLKLGKGSDTGNSNACVVQLGSVLIEPLSCIILRVLTDLLPGVYGLK
jgi:hypothetical protein